MVPSLFRTQSRGPQLHYWFPLQIDFSIVQSLEHSEVIAIW
ncbi:hypothetical protein Fuma_01200 [Fuerstiella marisgermanici]|uniref:Uncharacterized protein n=1 Tax=Fuerstiella marisgermanici TaxID=1891926 RepID=A0A1P8WC13_9PLAN|nr:hypothetical protein Fuma_01200 [Fuerstiella marisgermanici]